MWRGTSIGRDYTIFLATQMGATIHVDSGPHYWVPPELRAKSAETAAVIAEQRIRWAHGIGHADIYVPETGTIVEILSSAHASEDMRRSKLLQAVIYTEHHPRAENCAVVIVSPTDFTTERIVLVPSSPQYRDLREEMRERIGQIERWQDSGDLPARVCQKPQDARSHFCLFAAHCFAGWERPEPEQFEADETLVEAVAEFDACKRSIAARKPELDDLEKRKKEAQAVIEAADLPAGRPLKVGAFEVTRTAVQRKETFNLDAAEMAGVFDREMFASLGYIKAGASYSTFKAERAEKEDWGDDAPF